MVKKKNSKLKKNSKQVDMLIKTGIHFGHKKSRWHPSMKPFVYGQRNNMYIIDVEKTIEKLEQVLNFIKELSKEGKEIVFVGTKPNVREFLKKFAQQNNLFCVTERWIGGTLTNFSNTKKRLAYFRELVEKEKKGEFDDYPKKERRRIFKEIEHLEKVWGGVKNLSKMPAALFLLDVPNNYLAIKEAKKKGVKVIGVCDTDADIRGVDYPIPASDDSLIAVKYILDKVLKVVKQKEEKKKAD